MLCSCSAPVFTSCLCQYVKSALPAQVLFYLVLLVSCNIRSAPNRRIWHLKFQKFSGGNTPRPPRWERATPSRTHPSMAFGRARGASTPSVKTHTSKSVPPNPKLPLHPWTTCLFTHIYKYHNSPTRVHSLFLSSYSFCKTYTTLFFHDCSRLYMTFHAFAIFHDFPGLENGHPKFHDFPWPVAPYTSLAFSYLWCQYGIVANALVAINEVDLRCARLLLGWVTVCRQVNHLGM